MGHDGAIRASDSDRESVVEILRQAYIDGRLDLSEFDDRTTAAYAAKTWADLRQLTSDLPVDAVLGTDIAKPPVAAGTPWRPGVHELPDRPALPLRTGCPQTRATRCCCSKPGGRAIRGPLSRSEWPG